MGRALKLGMRWLHTWPARVLVWAFVGLALTAIVAWQLCSWRGAWWKLPMAAAPAAPGWIEAMRSGARDTNGGIISDWGVTVTAYWCEYPNGVQRKFAIRSSGWPMRALSGSTTYDIPPGYLDMHGPFAAGIHSLRPIPLGLLVNTACFGLAAFAAFRTIYAIVIWSRDSLWKQPGLCAKCRYPVQGLARCPECGTPAL